ncbi:hypothetical protein [Laceyella putida]|uniref:Transposase n=1 Tax=Laceyella putida TaxID=110101 RepID=A0ABW2RPB4_9BACL
MAPIKEIAKKRLLNAVCGEKMKRKHTGNRFTISKVAWPNWVEKFGEDWLNFFNPIRFCANDEPFSLDQQITIASFFSLPRGESDDASPVFK